MIKKLKNFICKLLGIKQCACLEEVLIVEETAKQKKIREKHKGETK
jgi:hypothetical protein